MTKTPQFLDPTNPLHPRLIFTDPETGDEFQHDIDFSIYSLWFCVIRDWGLESAVEMALMSARLVKVNLSELDKQRIKYALRDIKANVDLSRGNIDDFALRVSFAFLANGRGTRQQAADLASRILNKPINKEAWRKRVDRWVEDMGYETIEQIRQKISSKDKTGVYVHKDKEQP